LSWVLGSILRYWRQTIQVFKHVFGQENEGWSEVTVDELHERFYSNPPSLLIDVRSKKEYQTGHLPTARYIPMLELESKMDELCEFKDQEIVTMCPGGGLSLVAVDILQEAGFKNVKSLKGGTDEWIQKGYPIEKN
jgi:rhodanese-related sulfurtransferase